MEPTRFGDILTIFCERGGDRQRRNLRRRGRFESGAALAIVGALVIIGSAAYRTFFVHRDETTPRVDRFSTGLTFSVK